MRVLIVDEFSDVPPALLERLREVHEVELLCDRARALELIAERAFDVVFAEAESPLYGTELLRGIKRRWPDTEVVLFATRADGQAVTEGIRLGAYEVVRKPLEAEPTLLILSRAMERKRLREEAEHLRREVATAYSLGSPLGGPLINMTYHEALKSARDVASRAYVNALMSATDGNVTRAAGMAGIERESFHRLLRKLGLHSEAFKTVARRAR